MKNIVLGVLVIVSVSAACYWLLTGHLPTTIWLIGSFTGAISGALVFRWGLGRSRNKER